VNICSSENGDDAGAKPTSGNRFPNPIDKLQQSLTVALIILIEAQDSCHHHPQTFCTIVVAAMSTSTMIQTAQIAGITSSIALFGFNFSSSYVVLPTIYNQPNSVSTPIFTQIYYRGMKLFLSLAAVSIPSFSYLAYAVPQHPHRSLYAVGAATTLLAGAWTKFMMLSTIERLIAISESKVEQEKVSVKEVETLLKDWTAKNYIRSMFGLVGGFVGLYAAIGGRL